MKLNLEDLKTLLTGKIDSRVKDTNLQIVQTHPTAKLERTYCVYCHRPKGWVSQESYEYIKAQNIICICDDCESQLGALPLPEAKIEEL